MTFPKEPVFSPTTFLLYLMSAQVRAMMHWMQTRDGHLKGINELELPATCRPSGPLVWLQKLWFIADPSYHTPDTNNNLQR
ncbi:hypothetical protein BGZ60DRAFT_401238 [Tricladium varicosporioides]|nr:hypothetical protein BGZ60DRAFT_401238 [Hymenoscyphus varicosporioides]